MKTKNEFKMFAIFACLLAMGCSSGTQNIQATAQLRHDEVITIAKATAVQEGFDLSKYDLKGCHYESTKKDKTWSVFFQLKPPTPPGGHFDVWVDDQTKKAQLMRGE